MNTTAEPAQVEAADRYETLMVPALFEGWAPKVADAAKIGPGDRVLDVGCGTGVLGREAASRVGASGSVTGLDPNPGMLEVARWVAPTLEWRQGVAEALPFPDGSFDAVVSQFGLMFFEDRPRAVREALRVLAPGGRLAFAVWDSLERTPPYAAEVAVLERVAGARAADPLKAPFVLGDEEELARLFADAGAGSVRVATLSGRARFPSVRVMLEVDVRGWLPLVGVVLTEEEIAAILEEAESELEPWVTPEGSVAFDIPAHIVTGTLSVDRPPG